MSADETVPEPPGHLRDLVDRLLSHGFEEVQSDFARESFGNVMRVFERKPVRVRVVRDRGDWSADLTADGWPPQQLGDDWVFLPPLIAEGD